ncbi:MAG: restriction endonuclease subunit S, partial [Methylococcales bacterium]
MGVIPGDWEVKSIAQIAPLQRGFDLPTYRLKEGPYPVVYSNGIMTFHNKAMISGPGVITGRSGTLGNVHFVETDYWPHNTSLWVTNFYGNDARYVFYLYNSINFERFASGSGVPTLNRNDAHAFRIALPPTKAEQSAIAEALSDADALIESLEQLIDKKRHLKQGAMQELLTGKTRLRGFGGEWKVKRLEELADIRNGGTPSTAQPQFWDGDIPWCTPTDITGLNGCKYLSDTSRKISLLGLKSSSADVIPTKSVIMTSRATIGECAINRVPVSTNQGFKNFVPFEHVDVEFLYYMLRTQKQGFVALCGGSTFLEIGKTQLVSFEVRVPDAKAEQSAIATI